MSSFPSRKFPESKAKIPPRGFPKGKAKLASRKMAKAPKVEGKGPVTALPPRPTSEADRQARIAALKRELKALEDAKEPE